MIATLMVTLGNHTNTEVDENLFRHMCLNSIRANKMKFSAEYGQLVIACDAGKTWRREIFPYYKAARKKARSESELNWTQIFEVLNKVRDELKETFSYPVIHIEGAEADDIIGVLSSTYKDEKILILSGDHDFGQLQIYPNVKQYNPVLKKYLPVADPKAFLKEHVIRGDKGDGVPNMLSSDDSIVSGTRQKSISTKKLEQWVHQKPEEFCTTEDMLRGYRRNEQLVDLSFTPEKIRTAIIAEYESQLNKPKGDLFNYFMKHRLRNLVDSIGDF